MGQIAPLERLSGEGHESDAGVSPLVRRSRCHSRARGNPSLVLTAPCRALGWELDSRGSGNDGGKDGTAGTIPGWARPAATSEPHRSGRSQERPPLHLGTKPFSCIRLVATAGLA